MKGIYSAALVRAAAPIALAHWQARFEERKEAWIADVATKTVGWLRKRLVGRENAELYFEGGYSFDDCQPFYANGGVFWHEYGRIETLTYLISLTKTPGCDVLILKQEEMAALSAGISADMDTTLPAHVTIAGIAAKHEDE